MNDCIIINSPLPKTKCPRIPFRPGFLTSARGSGKDYKDFWPLARITRTKVVLARKYKEQGSGSTPALAQKDQCENHAFLRIESPIPQIKSPTILKWPPLHEEWLLEAYLLRLDPSPSSSSFQPCVTQLFSMKFDKRDLPGWDRWFILFLLLFLPLILGWLMTATQQGWWSYHTVIQAQHNKRTTYRHSNKPILKGNKLAHR